MSVASSLLGEKLPEILLVGGIVSYIVAMLFLTVMGSPIFFYGCYIGTFLFVVALMQKIELFSNLSWRRVAFIVLMFSSAMLFTTALVSIFTQVGISVHGFYDVKHIQYGSLSVRNPNGGAQGTFQPNGCLETRPLYSFAGYTLEILRPWVWIFGPAVVSGALLFVTGLIVIYRSE